MRRNWNLRARHSSLACLALLLVGFAQPSSGQVISGIISGSAVDPSRAAIPGALVTLINDATNASREVQAEPTGYFVFAGVQPGTYTLRISSKGFQTLERRGNVLTANTHLALGELELPVGTAAESITITAQGNLVQTGSAENSALLSSRQLETIGTRGRDVTSLLRLLPGVAVGAESETPGGPGFGNQLPNIMGSPANWSWASVDGLPGNDLGSAVFFTSPNMDSIGEVKVLLNNYQAEYGGNGAAIINMITKSGTSGFHGSAYWYKRHEMFNANNFFNNSLSIVKPKYRFNTLGANLGGPIPIGKLRDRLFFFYSFEDWRIKDPRPIVQITMPLESERRGDFSQTLDLNGALIPVRDPLSGRQPFAGNIIPPSRMNPSGQSILRLFPMPNTLDRAVTRGTYNFRFQESADIKKTQNVFRVDHRLTNKDNIYVRGSVWLTRNEGYNVPAHGPNFPLERAFYGFTDEWIAVNHTRIFTPTIVNEFSVGVRLDVEDGGSVTDDDLSKIQRSKTGVNVAQFHPEINPLNIIPQMSFAGVSSPPRIAFDLRFPIYGADTLTNLTETLTMTRSSHTVKAGFFLARGANGEGLRGRSNFAGDLNFGRDVNNPLETDWPYANALLGNFTSYVEASARPQQKVRIWTAAGFIQDSWKATRRLTLDVGLRFSWHNWYNQVDDKAAGLALERYDRSKAPLLHQPVSTPQGRRGVNPLTGEIVPAVVIGAYVPGTGNVANGMVLDKDPNYPETFREAVGLLPEPRIGFAYDIMGNGKTAIRGGFGVFHQLIEQGGYLTNFILNPPLVFNPQIYYSNFDSLLSSSGFLFPGNVYGYDRRSKTPSIYNYSLNVQRDIGFATILSVAYVGSVGRHLQWERNLNTVPYGARFLPENADPTNPALALNDNFFRPFPGYADVIYNEFAGSSNYNSLQVTANRRFVRGVQFGLSYTWSKALNFIDTDSSRVALYRPVHVWNYGKAGFDQTHAFVLNYTWDLPRASQLVSHPVVRFAFDNWRFSGITTFASGTPTGIVLSTVDNADITGGGDGVRANVIGKAQLPHGERTLTRWFDPTVFARPPRGDPGNAPKDVFRGPGINNWDLFLFKEVPIGKETRHLELRWEMYNVFNHAQFLGVDNSARFDTAGRQVNGRFGQVISARSPRVMQASLRFSF